MKITLVPGRELDADLVGTWIQLQQTNPDLVSPYFHPQFTKIIAEVRNDIEIAVLESGGKIVGFFPFQREQLSHAQPVGSIISDYHGLICSKGLEFSPIELMRQCRLADWSFDHLITTQSSFQPYYWSTDASPQIDLSQGYQAYVQERRAAGSEQIKKIHNLMRRIEREVGPLSFVAKSIAPRSFATVLDWKSQQYLKSGNSDLFAPGWVREAVSRISRSNVEGFAGMLSLLYAGDRMVAGHIGMRSHRAWHYWFPAYDPALAKYSPGLMLLLKMAGHAPEIGVRILDLGKGVNSYKERLMNSSSLLANGRLEIPSLRSFYGVASRELRSRLQNSFLQSPARVALQCLRKWRHGGRPEAK